MALDRLLLWTLLAACAAASALLLRLLQVPGAVLLGPMAVAIAFALAGAELKLKPAVLLAVQAVLGCMVASAVTAPLLRLLAAHWPMVLAANVLSVVAACAIALVLTRMGLLPGQSAIWGLSPGAASTMMMMGEARGEDPRVIAMMQNLRIVAVTLTATAVAACLGRHPAAVAVTAETLLHAPATVPGLATLGALAAVGVVAAAVFRWTQAAFWVPVICGGALNLSGLGEVVIPAPVAATAFGVGGCYAGLRFNRQALRHCLRLLPAMALGTGLLMASCLALAWPIHRSFDEARGLTAFLAIMPGGIDAAVAIAQGVDASVPVIVAVQVMRLVVVSLIAPPAARIVASLCAGPGR